MPTLRRGYDAYSYRNPRYTGTKCRQRGCHRERWEESTGPYCRGHACWGVNGNKCQSKADPARQRTRKQWKTLCRACRLKLHGILYCAVIGCFGDLMVHGTNYCDAHRCMTKKGCRLRRSVLSERGFCGYHRMTKELRVVPV